MKSYLERSNGKEYYYPVLISKIKDKGIRLGNLAKMINMNYYLLSRKINGKIQFKADEANKICKILNSNYDELFYSPYKNKE